VALRTECQSAQMSKIKNGRLDQYGAETFEQHQSETAGVKGVKITSFDIDNVMEAIVLA